MRSVVMFCRLCVVMVMFIGGVLMCCRAGGVFVHIRGGAG